MATIRRWYIFLVCAISLVSVTWAIIALIKNLLDFSTSSTIAEISFEIAVIVIGLPIFLVHWLLAQRLAGRDTDERQAGLRRLYLYGVVAYYLGYALNNAYFLLAGSPLMRVPGELIAVIVLGVLGYYHWRIVAQESKRTGEKDNLAVVRRLFVFGYSGVGLYMTSLAVIHLLRGIMQPIGGAIIGDTDLIQIRSEVARLVVGLPVWVIFWRWMERLFAGDDEEEHQSALRKLYLYLIIFIAALTAVSNATMILAGGFRRLLELPPSGDIRVPLPIVIAMAGLWAYHAFILRSDEAAAGEAPRQAGLRRLYLYLIAAVGLAAFLAGLSGVISVLIRSLAAASMDDSLREQLAWFTAALITGLPVWILPWRRAQAGALSAEAPGVDERRSIVRKIYLYFYLFVATMTVLSGMVYIVYQLLKAALGAGEAGALVTSLGQAIAYSLIAAGVWLYHGMALRGDDRLNQQAQTRRLSEVRVAVVDLGGGFPAQRVMEGLQRDLPGLVVEPVQLSPTATAAEMQAQYERLANASLIVGPWNMILPGGAVSLEFACAITASLARKLLAPARMEGWDLAGMDRWDAEAALRQTLHAVQQILHGEEVKAARPLSVGAIIGIAIGVLFLLILVGIPLLIFFG